MCNLLKSVLFILGILLVLPQPSFAQPDIPIPKIPDFTIKPPEIKSPSFEDVFGEDGKNIDNFIKDGKSIFTEDNYESNKADKKKRVEDGDPKWNVAWGRELTETDLGEGVGWAVGSFVVENPAPFIAWMERLVAESVAKLSNEIKTKFPKELKDGLVEIATKAIRKSIESGKPSFTTIRNGVFEFKAGAIKYSGENQILGGKVGPSTAGMIPYVAIRVGVRGDSNRSASTSSVPNSEPASASKATIKDVREFKGDWTGIPISVVGDESVIYVKNDNLYSIDKTEEVTKLRDSNGWNGVEFNTSYNGNICITKQDKLYFSNNDKPLKFQQLDAGGWQGTKISIDLNHVYWIKEKDLYRANIPRTLKDGKMTAEVVDVGGWESCTHFDVAGSYIYWVSKGDLYRSKKQSPLKAQVVDRGFVVDDFGVKGKTIYWTKKGKLFWGLLIDR